MTVVAIVTKNIIRLGVLALNRNQLSFKCSHIIAGIRVEMISLILCFVSLSGLSHEFQKVLPSDCKDQNFFDASRLTCRPCDVNNIPSINRLRCQCKPGLVLRSDSGSQTVECTQCPSGQVAAPDGLTCLLCEGKQSVADCQQCFQDEIFAYRNLNGVIESPAKCTKCIDSTRPSSDDSHCVACNDAIFDKQCICGSPNILIGGLCFKPADLADIPDAANLYTVIFQRNVKIISSYFKSNIRAAYVMCKIYANTTACQLLGNLCVFIHYSKDSGLRGGEGACNLYDKISRLSNQAIEWPAGMPMLFYVVNEATTILSKQDINGKFTQGTDRFDSYLRFLLAAYDMNGNFVGFLSLEDALAQLCSGDSNSFKTAFRIGRKYQKQCSISWTFLADFQQNWFYDVYLDYKDRQGISQLYLIPVLNLNIESAGSLINTQNQRSRWILTRRIFLSNNVNAKEDDQTNSTARFIRHIKSMKISTELQNTMDGSIYPPMMTVEYDDFKYNENSLEDESTFTFEIQYMMDTAEHEKNIEITMGVLCSLAVLWSFLRIWSWSRRSGKLAIDFMTIVKGLLFLLFSLADVFLVVQCFTSWWLLVFHKYQKVPVLFLPTSKQEYSFVVYLCLLTIFKLIEMIDLIIENVRSRVFFIDWERSRGHIIPRTGEASGQSSGSKIPSPITIWRTYFVANEWNELQDYRKTSLVIQLLAMVFLLKVGRLEALAVIEPGLSTWEYVPEFCDSRISRFAVASFLYYVIGFTQWTFNVMIVERVLVDHFRSFVDLCSISNISVLILQHSHFGYYIHGRSVHGYADTDMREMNEMLQRERDNLCPKRGLEINKELQTFMVHLPRSFRQQLDRILSPLQNAPRIETHGIAMNVTDKTTLKTNMNIEVYNQMNRYLSSFIDHTAVGADYIIKDRTMLECVLNMEFQDTSVKGVFYRDSTDASYARALVYGNEYVQLTFELALFCFVDMIAKDFFVSAVLVFIVSSALKLFRCSAVKKNLARMSLIDERFLI